MRDRRVSFGPNQGRRLGEEASGTGQREEQDLDGQFEKVRASRLRERQGKAQGGGRARQRQMKAARGGNDKPPEGVGAAEWLGLEPEDAGSQPRSGRSVQGA